LRNIQLFHIVSFVLLSFFSWQSSAQYTSTKGRFEATFVKGCPGLIINITTNTGLADVQYWFEVPEGDGDYIFDPANPGNSVDTEYTYNNVGRFYIIQGVSDQSAGTDSLFVEIKSPELPEFTIHNCSNYNTVVEITGAYYDAYNVEFMTGVSQDIGPNSFSDPHDFGGVGDQSITVIGSFNESPSTGCGVATAPLTPISMIATPVLQLVNTVEVSTGVGVTELGHGVIDANGDPQSLPINTIYNLEKSINGSLDFEWESIVDGPISSLNGLNTKDEYQCYRINTYDACSASPSTDTLFSEVVCSVYFDVAGTEQANTITWQTDSLQAISYNLLRNGELLTRITNTSINSYDDSNVICNQEYTYGVNPIFDTGYTQIIGLSQTKDTTVIAEKSQELPAVGYPSSSVTDNEVVLTWGPPDTGEIPFRQYIIEKNIRDRIWKVYDTADDTTFTDASVNFVIGKHSYRISYDDDCGNLATPSPSTDPMVFTQGVVRGRVVTFEWLKYETWLDGIKNYVVERIDEEGNVMEEYSVLSGRSKEIEFSPNDSEDKIMRVRAESLSPVPEFTYSNAIITQLNTEMFLPNAFTPDNDGLNDLFVAKGPKVFNFKMEIYNRWGGLIFVTDDNFNGWDGTFNDEEAPEGTYIYKIYFEDAEMRSYDQSGSMVLLRQN
jgi:gliding motility-associated-like protein